MDDLRSPQLPWLVQDRWTCDRAPATYDTVVLESDGLRADITPRIGGKIWSLFDKTHKKDMVFDNPAHQPAYIATRGAWASGGIEMNFSPGIIGHSVFAESPAFVARLDTARGPVVRVYEFDRYNGTVWQVRCEDAWSRGSAFLRVCVRASDFVRVLSYPPRCARLRPRRPTCFWKTTCYGSTLRSRTLRR